MGHAVVAHATWFMRRYSAPLYAPIARAQGELSARQRRAARYREYVTPPARRCQGRMASRGKRRATGELKKQERQERYSGTPERVPVKPPRIATRTFSQLRGEVASRLRNQRREPRCARSSASVR